MQVYFKLIHPDVQKQLLGRAQKKLLRLRRLIDEGQYEAQAYVEIVRATGSQHSQTAWEARINLDARGQRFHAKALDETPEKALERAVRELRSELRTHHARERSLRRKADGFWKSFMHGDFTAP